MKPLDLSLYFVVHREPHTVEKMIDIIMQAIEGGVKIVQLREKKASKEEFCETGRLLLKRLRPLGIPLIINDRVDVAKAIQADGVHLGQSDMPVADARAMLGPKAIIGHSVNTFEQGLQAQHMDIDYLGAGPIWSTPTKADCGEPWDLADLERLCKVSSFPIVAIGGINASNVEKVVQCQVAGVAVVSAILNAPNPKLAAQGLAQPFSYIG